MDIHHKSWLVLDVDMHATESTQSERGSQDNRLYFDLYNTVPYLKTDKKTEALVVPLYYIFLNNGEHRKNINKRL